MIVKAAPAIIKINHDDAVRARRRGIGDESRAFLAATQVEADVVQIRGRQGHIRREAIFLTT